MTSSRLISADSHVAINLDVIRERVPHALRDAFDDATAAQARQEEQHRQGRKIAMEDWDMEARRDPGYHDPVARLAAMDRDGVHAEVLYSEVSAFRSYGLVKGDWKPISRAFNDHLSDFASIAPDRLAVARVVAQLEPARVAHGRGQSRLPRLVVERGDGSRTELSRELARRPPQLGLLG